MMINTIWQALTEKLGREPTHAEAKAEVQRIIHEARMEPSIETRKAVARKLYGKGVV
jgi:hypothetical protein